MIFQAKDVQLYYEVSGSGEPLILLHGNGETHAIFDKAIPLLEQHFTVYAVDTRGHGQSSPVKEFHYEDMADDICQFITGLGLEKPTVYGFSDGGILCLLLAIHHPDLLSRIIVSGANTNPQGVKSGLIRGMKIVNFFARSPKIKLMLTEPHITDDQLAAITIPVFQTAGSKDLVTAAHVQHIHDIIPGCVTKIFEGDGHGSYIVHNTRLAEHILEVCGK